jgi:predicted acylesterase/phospholipase RssA
MVGKFIRPGPLIGLGLIVIAAALGCAGGDHLGREPIRGERSLEDLRASVGWYDVAEQNAIQQTIRSEDLYAFAVQARESRKPTIPFPHKSILVLTGGGSYGAYPAGVLVGWSESGTRPVFDVVTGTSTGALIGCFAFLGQEYDADLRRAYTCMRNEDLYRKRHFPASVLSESLADSAPLAKLIAESITDARVQAMGAEYHKGRRFYVGTSDLDARRSVIWDITALAARDTPGDRELVRNILLASSSIPGFFPPVNIPVIVDGVRHIERHVDGVTSSSMFFVPPWVPPEKRETLPANWLYGSDLYILVAGKLYADPTPVKARTVSIASQAVSTILYDQTRSDLHRMFLLSILTGMNYNVSSIPEDVKAPGSSTEFHPEVMGPLLEAGERWAKSNRKWRETPPGYEWGEGAKYRAGTVLTDTGRRTPVGLPGTEGVPVPVIPEKK